MAMISSTEGKGAKTCMGLALKRHELGYGILLENLQAASEQPSDKLKLQRQQRRKSKIGRHGHVNVFITLIIFTKTSTSIMPY